MTRLNKTIREAIINNAVEASGVNSREEALIKRRAKLADDVRLFAIGGPERENELNKLYDNAVKYAETHKCDGMIHIDVCRSSSYEINVNFSGRSVDLYFTGEPKHSYDNRVSKPYVNSSYRSRIAITIDNPLNDEFDAIIKEQRVINELRTQISAEVRAMVNSVTTVKKLLELWPESKGLLPESEKPSSTALVADVSKLNTTIGLPKPD